ncbi:MAG: sirohydrochlorin cobaltochelatase [Deltaproteobacteria bacterium]|nr:sirohydrochlorin cobaltochelatase [Deltaproteobacteria bacterium]
MTSKSLFIAILAGCLLFTCWQPALAGHGSQEKADKVAIVIASFGTTVPNGIAAIANIQKKITEAFPGVPVRLTFTSNIIRSVWKKRQAEADKWLAQGTPKDFLYVKGIIPTIGDLIEDGYQTIIVQPTHIYQMEQYMDLLSYVNALNSIKTIKKRWMPIKKIVVGRPAMGQFGDRYDYHEDMKKALETLGADAELARRQGAVLVYMAHGNEYMSTGIYCEAQKMMRQLYPDVQTFFGSVEGFPGLADVVKSLRHAKSKKVVLKPFMIVAGDHATNDMAGEEADSWKNVIAKQGFQVYPVLTGLGQNDAFAELFVAHIKDAARDNGISLAAE